MWITSSLVLIATTLALMALLPTAVDAVSSGQLEYCSFLETDPVRQYGYEEGMDASRTVMAWVKPPMPATFYTLRTGGGPRTNDVDWYTPGQLVKLNLETRNLDKKFVGLMMYALANVTSVTTGITEQKQVGTWEVETDRPFWSPANCKFKAVLHSNADIKPLSNQFFWRAPDTAGYGTVEFRVLIKQGEQGKGSFYYPAETLQLTEQDLTAPPTSRVYRGMPRHSCNTVCADVTLTTPGVVGADGVATSPTVTPTPKACDETATAALGTFDTLRSAAAASSVMCRVPLLLSCDKTAPTSSTMDRRCYYNDATKCTAPAQRQPTACDATSDDQTADERLCVCKTGTPVRDPVPDANDIQGKVLKTFLETPVTLHTDGTTLQSLVITEHRVDVTVTAPSTSWVGIGWDTFFMEGTYATIFATAVNPDLKSRQPMPTDAVSGSTSGWFDVQCQGALNDYCRTAQLRGPAAPAEPVWTCALAGAVRPNGAFSTTTPAGAFVESQVSTVPCKFQSTNGVLDVDASRLGTNALAKHVPVPLTAADQPRTLQERILGDHTAGELLGSSDDGANAVVTLESVVDTAGMSTITFSRAREVATPRYTFPIDKTSYHLLWAVGDSTPQLSYHGSLNHVSTRRPLTINLQQHIEVQRTDPVTGVVTTVVVDGTGRLIDGSDPDPIDPDPKVTSPFIVTATSSTAYIISGGALTAATENPAMSLSPGEYVFDVDASGHPFWIVTSVGDGDPAASALDAASVQNNGVDKGQVLLTLTDSVTELYYVCGNHPVMTGILVGGSTSAAVSASSSPSTAALLLTVALTAASFLSMASSTSSSSSSSSCSVSSSSRRRHVRHRSASSLRAPNTAVLAVVGAACVIAVAIYTPFVGVHAHNFIGGPSRAEFASVLVPCQPRYDRQPHVQIGADQEFEIEWATGHGDTQTQASYFVALHEDDYDQLRSLTSDMLEEYIQQADELDHVDVKSTNSRLQKRHVAPLSTFGGGGARDGEITATNENKNIHVSRDPVYAAKSRNVDITDLRIYKYSTQERRDDVRVTYTSLKYPWIESVSRFMIYAHEPKDVDMAVFTLPARRGAGSYIMHYMWGGYRDCIDVDVKKTGTVVAQRYGTPPSNPGAAGPVKFARLYHAEFRYVRNPATPCTVVKPNAGTSHYDVTPCLDACGALSINDCSAVQMVRYKNVRPGTLDYTVSLPTMQFRLGDKTKNITSCALPTIHQRTNGVDEFDVPTGEGACANVSNMCSQTSIDAQTPGDDDMVCYGLIPGIDTKKEAEEKHEHSTDLSDPKFDNTVWFRLHNSGFQNIDDRPVLPDVPWEFPGKDRCVSCATRNAMAKLSVELTPSWRTLLTQDCVKCPELTLEDL